MKKLILILMLLPIMASAQDKYNPLSLFEWNANGFVTDTSDTDIGIYFPNDIIYVMPSQVLTGGWLWTISSEHGDVITSVTCECEVRDFLDMLVDYPATKEDLDNGIMLYYSELLKERWHE